MSLQELLERIRATEDFSLPASWAQGRAGFGGAVAALAEARMQQALPQPRPLRSLAVSFVAPLQSEQPARIQTRLLRQGRAVSQVAAEVLQDGQVTALLHASYGEARASQVRIEPLPAPAMAAPEACRPLPQVAGLTPAFLEHIALNWGEGDVPFSGSRSRSLGGWVRLRDPEDAELTDSHLLALLDAWPPAPLMQLSAPAAGSTLSWSVDFVQPRPQGLRAGDWYLFRAHIDQAADGYAQVTAGFWNATGELLANSRQTVTIFA